MSRSDTNADYFFQTSASIEQIERRKAKSKNALGRPIKLPSKLLAVLADPYDERAVYVAEAAGELKRVVLETGEQIPVSHHTAPLTSLALTPSGQRLFTGCWDKQIYSTDFESGESATLSGHTDFVKCLLATSISGIDVLISGGSDATIIVWNLETSKPRYKLKGHGKAVLGLAVDPLSLPASSNLPGKDFVLFSASSDREIRRWRVGLEKGFEEPESLEKAITVHETSVYALAFDSDGDLWTASADRTARHLVRERGWEADTTLDHGDFVTDVLVAEDLGLVVTACRDEGVRVWDMSSGELVVDYQGHFEDVTGLVRVGTSMVVTVSIDGTLRQWSLDRTEIGRYVKEREDEEQRGAASQVKVEPSKKPALSAEEEAELAELMDETDDE